MQRSAVMKIQSVSLVGVQVVCIVYILLSGFWLASPTWVWLELVGVALGAWAIATMKLRHLNAFPEPRRDARMVTAGPYRWIRHPMYSGALVMTLALVIDQPTLARGIAWLILLADLLVKLHYEETLMSRRFPEYVAYRKRTKRLIPLVY